MQKALFFDIDGTLVHDRNKISERMTDILIKWKQEKNFIFAVTGRSWRKFIRLDCKFEWDGYILHNGSNVVLGNNIISRKQIKLKKVRWLINKLSDYGYDYGLETGDCFFSNFTQKDKLDRNSRDIALLKINDSVDIDKIIIMNNKLPSFLLKEKENFNIVLMDNMFICITHKQANKLTACQKIINELHLQEDKCYYFGNDENDKIALEYFFHSVVVLNPLLDISKQSCIYINHYSDLENYVLTLF